MQRQEDYYKFETRLVYIARPCLEKEKKKTTNKPQISLSENNKAIAFQHAAHEAMTPG